jgi:hypothetical protein
MPTLFTLDVSTDPAARHATLRLGDGEGRHLAAHEVALSAHPPAQWTAAFETRAHVRRMARRGAAPEQQLDELGAFLGAHVLGPDIAGRLAAGIEARTLLVRLPDVPDDRLAVAFAGIPWEIARAPGDKLTLLQRTLRSEDEKEDGSTLAGTALALLRAGVKQVAVMHWEVGDVHARRLAKALYRHEGLDAPPEWYYIGGAQDEDRQK